MEKKEKKTTATDEPIDVARTIFSKNKLITWIFNKIKTIYKFIEKHIKLYKFKRRCKKNNSVVIKPLILNNTKYMHLGKKVRIKEGARIECYDKFADKILLPELSIEDNVIIEYNFSCLVADKVRIGKNTILASNVLITSENHGINPEIETPYYEQPLSVGPVTIGEGCWIGEKVIILPNVSIGKKCVIGAGTIVTKSIPDYSIVVGTPARIIKKYNFEKHEWI